MVVKRLKNNFGVFLLFIIVVFLFSISSNSVISYGNLTCSMISSSNCPSGTVKLIGFQNETGGLNSAHAQNFTIGTYSNSICCNSTNTSISINNSCNMGSVVMRLFDNTNSHVQSPNMTSYNYPVCLNTTYQNITCATIESSCNPGQTCIASLGNSEGVNYTNAHVAECAHYSTNLCCGFSNSAPTAPSLIYPVNGNTSVFERYVNFSWSASSDPESNSITYSLNATCGAGCSCTSINFGGLTSTNYTYGSPLCYDVNYNWSVTACDSYNSCSTSSTSNFTIASVLDFILISNSSDFGSFSLGQTKDTLSNSPNPMVGRNNGNVLVNATVNATPLFSSVSFNTSYYQFLAADNETSSIVTGCSQTSFENMSLSQKNLLCNLSYLDANDEVRIDINITVPVAESSGEKSSILEVVASGAG